MKHTETQLDNVLSHRAADEAVHVVHDSEQNFTISYIVTDVIDDGQMQGLSVTASIARRNPEDNFCRRLGRLISKGRLANDGDSQVLLYQERNQLPETSEQWRALDAFVVASFPSREER